MKVVALSGGVGGARLASGLASVIKPNDLTMIETPVTIFIVGAAYLSGHRYRMYHLAGMERENPVGD